MLILIVILIYSTFVSAEDYYSDFAKEYAKNPPGESPEFCPPHQKFPPQCFKDDGTLHVYSYETPEVERKNIPVHVEKQKKR